jgi:hypothetical protein
MCIISVHTPKCNCLYLCVEQHQYYALLACFMLSDQLSPIMQIRWYALLAWCPRCIFACLWSIFSLQITYTSNRLTTVFFSRSSSLRGHFKIAPSAPQVNSLTTCIFAIIILWVAYNPACLHLDNACRNMYNLHKWTNIC